eukprot:TRINITY_DN1835_c0_g2_i2.p1 TRINITY_DN1835_c0_g2~~TRINITY_DN1835_c0_g2_i2.p1  ORF type:complete len:779 (-),score=174.24 TRINITY_DN1835_c0_g2_i2:34-2370(-)
MADSIERKKHFFDLIAVSVIVGLSCVIFSNGLHGDFVFDDATAIVSNTDVNPKSPIMNIFKHDFWGQDISNDGSHKSFRPLTTYSFRLNRQFFQKKEDVNNGDTPLYLSYSFHVVNLVLHVATCVVLYFFGVHIYSLGRCDSSLQTLISSIWQTRVVPFIATLMFVCHPAHVEAVTGLVGRADLFCALFSMLAVLCYSRACKYDYKWDDKNEDEIRYEKEAPLFLIPFSAWMWMLLSMFFVTMSNMAKELGFAAIGAVLIYDFFVGFSGNEKSILQVAKKRNLTATFTRIGIVSATAVALMIFRKIITVDFVVPNFRRLENPVAYTKGIYFLLSCGVIHLKYMELLIFPTRLSSDYSFNCIPMVESIYDKRNILTGLMYLSLFVLGVWLLRNFRKLWARRSLFLLGWVAGFFMPASHLVFYVGTTVAERLLYVPSICSCLLIAEVILAPFTCVFWRETDPSTKKNERKESEEKEEVDGEMKKKGNNGKAMEKLVAAVSSLPLKVIGMVVIFCTVAFFSRLTYVHNPVWNNATILFEHGIKMCPNSAKAQYFVAGIHYAKKEYTETIPYLKRAYEIEPRYCDVNYALGVCYFQTGSKDLGHEYFWKGVDCKPTLKESYDTLVALYRESLKENPKNLHVYKQWGLLLEKANMTEDAGIVFLEIAGMVLGDGSKKVSEEEVKIATAYISRAVEVAPHNCTVTFMSAQLLVLHGMHEQSIPLYEKTADIYRCPDYFGRSVETLLYLYGMMVEKNPKNEEYNRQLTWIRVRVKTYRDTIAKSN